MEKVYKLDEIKSTKFQSIVNAASGLWQLRMDEHREKNPGHVMGTCAVGAGFYVYYVPKRCRKPRRFFIVEPRGEQSWVVWEPSKDEIAEFLMNHGIVAYYTPGRLD
jgi:hypothetical protein